MTNNLDSRYISCFCRREKSRYINTPKRDVCKPPKTNTCAYCGETVPDGTGSYTEGKMLLLCQTCKPTFFTPLHKRRQERIRLLKSEAL